MSALSELIELRRAQRELEAKIAEVQQAAALEAMSQFSATGQKTFSYQGIKIQLQFWKKKPKPTDDPELGRIKKLIEAEAEYLQAMHAERIAETTALIKTLQEQVEKMVTSDRITDLKAQYTDLEDKLTELQPKVAVTLP